MSLTPEQLRAYVDYLRDMGVFELYRKDAPNFELPAGFALRNVGELRGPSAPERAPLTASAAPSAVRPAAAEPFNAIPPRQSISAPVRPAPPAPQAARMAAPPDASPSLPPEFQVSMPKSVPFDELAPLPTRVISAAERPQALKAIRADIGDCTRCPLAYAGRHKIVFADGDPNARLMFVGEGPGADEDMQGLPFVGKAGQLLNNMISAMGVQREQVYIANVVKCRPPQNRTPEPVEANTCSQFLVRQIDVIQPQVIVALGATAAKYLLGVQQSLASLRGKWHSCRGAKVAVTYHPAFLLRDPRQKGEAWKDLQMVMAEMGLKPAPRKA